MLFSHHKFQLNSKVYHTSNSNKIGEVIYFAPSLSSPQSVRIWVRWENGFLSSHLPEELRMLKCYRITTTEPFTTKTFSEIIYTETSEEGFIQLLRKHDTHAWSFHPRTPPFWQPFNWEEWKTEWEYARK